jgi:hypothetical protein
MPNEKDFVIENGVLLKCTSNDNILIIPNGVTDIVDALADWKGDTIVCPSSLKNYLYENGLFYFDNKASTVVLSPDTNIQKIWDTEMRIIKDYSHSIGPSTLTIAFSDEQSFKDSLKLIANSKIKRGDLYECFLEKSFHLGNILENKGVSELEIEREVETLYDDIMEDTTVIEYNVSLVNDPELDKYYNDAFVSEHYDFKDGVLTFKDADSFRACLYLQGEFPHNVVLSIPNTDIVKKIILPKDIETIPSGCLKDFKSLEELEAKSVKKLEDYALCGCSSLKKLELHPDIKRENIGDNALYYCTSLTDAAPEIMAERYTYKEIEIPEPDENGFVIEDGMLSRYLGNNKDILIPDGVKGIDIDVFYNQRFLESAILPEGITYIDRGAFEECIHLRKMDFPNSLTLIGGDVFRKCYSLESVTFEGNPKLGEHVFEDCYNLKVMIVRNEKMKQYLYETGNVPEGCEVKVVEKEKDINKTTTIGKLIESQTKGELVAGDEVLNKQEQLSVPVTPSGEDISHDDDNHDEF